MGRICDSRIIFQENVVTPRSHWPFLGENSHCHVRFSCRKYYDELFFPTPNPFRAFWGTWRLFVQMHYRFSLTHNTHSTEDSCKKKWHKSVYKSVLSLKEKNTSWNITSLNCSYTQNCSLICVPKAHIIHQFLIQNKWHFIILISSACFPGTPALNEEEQSSVIF